jgi:Predicted phosphotransferase related to Ser/Thr protein kinases
MRDALGALVTLQRIDGAGVVPVYDAALLQRELDLFPEWFVQRHHGHVLSDAQSAALQGIFAALIANNLAQPQVLVHRDWHSRNLMVTPERNPGVLDFSGRGDRPHHLRPGLAAARRLYRLARRAAARLGHRYWERARKAELPVAPTPLTSIATSTGWACSARSRCWASSPGCTTATARRSTRRPAGGAATHPAGGGALRRLQPLLQLLDQIEQRSPLVGYTF